MKRAEYADTSDMNAYGWFSDYDGTIYREVMFNYMDLVKFTGELKGQERIQIALSNFIKGNLEVELLLQSQRTLMMRDYGEDFMPNWYTEEGMELAGIADLPKMSKKQKKKKTKKRRKIEHLYV